MLEPFITPDLFQRYAAAGAIDEWTISTLMAADTANGGLAQLEHHYDTFFVRHIPNRRHIPLSLRLIDSHVPSVALSRPKKILPRSRALA